MSIAEIPAVWWVLMVALVFLVLAASRLWRKCVDAFKSGLKDPDDSKG